VLNIGIASRISGSGALFPLRKAAIFEYEEKMIYSTKGKNQVDLIGMNPDKGAGIVFMKFTK
jgi:hypothetical protein